MRSSRLGQGIPEAESRGVLSRVSGSASWQWLPISPSFPCVGTEEHAHIGVRFFDGNREIEPAEAPELRRAIRAHLQKRYSPKSGEVALSSRRTGWIPMEKRCWVHGVAGGSGPAYSKSIESDVLATLARLGKLARE